MNSIIFKTFPVSRNRLKRVIKRTKNVGIRIRAIIILMYSEGKNTGKIADAVRYDPSAVRKVRIKYLLFGRNAIYDRRSENGQAKVDEDLLEALRFILSFTSEQWGFKRPTWTLKNLAIALRQITDTSVSEATISRMLRKIRAKWKMPKPVVWCPWPEARKRHVLRKIDDLVNNLPRDEVAFYEDEVDIDLNPRIGRDWMLSGVQRHILTPGKNKKHYLAGALDAKTGKMTWTGNGRKNSYLFSQLLRTLNETYPHAKRIHVILDNFCIHKSRFIENVMKQEFAGRVELHFLPPYCPDENRIERVWKDLHDNVTRNHRCVSLGELLKKVEDFLKRLSPRSIVTSDREKIAA